MLLKKNPTKSSYWLKSINNPFQPKLWSPESDITIIGAGIAGGSLALHLSKLNPKLRVTVLDARGIAGGATGRNGGLLWPSLPDRWSDLVRNYGVNESKKFLEFSLLNCNEIKRFVDTLPSDCENHPKLEQFPGGAVHLMSSIEDLNNWAIEIEEMKKCGGCLDIGIWNQKELDSKLKTSLKQYHGAIHDRLAYRVRAASLVYHFIKTAHQIFESNGGHLNVHTNTSVTKVDSLGDRMIVHTDNQSISTKKVIYCTNGFTDDLLPEAKITPIKNQVIVTKPLKNIPFDFAITANSGYEYMSPREDGRIVMGGLRFLATNADVGNADDASLSPKISNALATYLQSQFPEISSQVEIEEEWSGIMGWSQDRLPYVGELPDRQNEYICAGFSGHGMPRAYLCAKACAQLVLGHDLDTSFPTSFLTDHRYGKLESKNTFASKF
ncbi:FAD dependent oxidoreductase [Globomyces pollinis-pini]|nr:FAD dependent oxidoreductase [Globomyces pollinis-pini]